MNKEVEAFLIEPGLAYADYLRNASSRLDADAEAQRMRQGARVGVSRKHESAHLHVAGQATYIDDMPELAGTLHAALARMSVIGAKSFSSAAMAALTVASFQGWPTTAASAFAARLTTAAMPPNAKRAPCTRSSAHSMARPAATAEMSQSNRLDSL